METVNQYQTSEIPENQYSNLPQHRDRYDVQFDGLQIREYIPRKIAEFRYLIQDASIPNSFPKSSFTYSDRKLVIEWLFSVHKAFKLLPETFFTAVNYFDRCLHKITTGNAQLTISACSLLAAKMNEIYAPESNDYVYVGDGSFTEEMLLNQEKNVLIMLGGHTTQPTIIDFIRLNSSLLQNDFSVHAYSKILAHLAVMSTALSIPSGEVLTFASGKTICHPSSVAAGCSFAADLLLETDTNDKVNMLCDFNNLRTNEIFIIADFVIAAAKMAIKGIKPSKFYFQELTSKSNRKIVVDKELLNIVEIYSRGTNKPFIKVIQDYQIDDFSLMEDYIHGHFTFIPYAPSPLVRQFKIEISQIKKLEDKYIKNNLLGSGTYGKVYSAKSVLDGSLVAIKISSSNSWDNGMPTDVLREIATGVTVNFHKCPSTLKLQKVFLRPGKIYLITSLERSHLREFPIENKHKKSVLLQITESIHCMHSSGIIHRDLKPQNILTNDLVEIKVADFGLCRSVSLPMRNYTHEVITLWYRPPEILLGQSKYDFSADIWSLGCIFYEVFTGAPLFSGANAINQIHKIYRKLGTPNNAVWDGVENLPEYVVSFQKWARLSDGEILKGVDASNGGDELVRKLILKMLKYDPEDRPDIDEILNDEYFSR